MERNNPKPYYVKIRVRGAVVGKLYLLGTEMNTQGTYHFYVVSNGKIEALAYMCEGFFEGVVRLADSEGNSGKAFLGKRNGTINPLKVPFTESLQFMHRVAQSIQEKVEAQILSQEG